MAPEIVGREVELAAARAFIDAADGGPAALVFEGEAGIGKSTLWLAAVASARERGWRVLSSRPAEAERTFAHVGLGDLLEAVLDRVLPALSVPRRRALEVALLRDEASADVLDARALAVAVRDALQLLGEEAPTLVAVDDVQWLDASSSSALAFAARRLDADVRVLLARRLDGGGPTELEQSFDGDRLQRLSVGPLSAGALHRFLHERLGRSFGRQMLLGVHERSGGNPLFALELARLLDEDVDPFQPLPVPETLDQILRARLSELPGPTLDALAFVAALGAPSASLLERAGVDADALVPAFSAQVIEREHETIRFTHPLLSSAVHADLGEKRRTIHARLAEVVGDPLARARHTALATDESDAEAAAALDDAVALAAERGAAPVAAELAEHALRLTPPQEAHDRRRRALAAARAELAAGEWTRSRAIVRALLEESPAGPLRAEALLLLAEFEHDDLAVPVLEEALSHASVDLALEARVRIRLAWAERFRKGFAAALEDSRVALELADRLDDDGLRLDALANMHVLGAFTGDPDAQAYAARGHALVTGGDASLPSVVLLFDFGDIEAERAVLEREYREWETRDEVVAAGLLWDLSWLELWAGRWRSAAEHAARARDVRRQYGVEQNQDFIPIAWIALHRGQLELAFEESEQALELCREQIGFHPPLLQAVPGLVALWRGDAASAVEQLAEAERQAAALAWGAPDARPWTPDHVEALLELGRVEEAVALLDRWEADARRLEKKRVLAQVTRSRGLVAAARGAVQEAVDLLEQACISQEDAGDAFGQARALLALGVVRRRARQKRAAREAIASALAGFEALGAATWVEKAQGELGSIDGRRREDGLTAAERRVAILVAEGRTNREVAAALFLAERTVAGHLTSVYAKLGVRSRTELSRRLS